MFKKLSPVVLLAIGAAVYFLLIKPKSTAAAAQAATTRTGTGPTTTSAAPDPLAALIGQTASGLTTYAEQYFGAKKGTGGFDGFGMGLAGESRAIEGMAPASLAGHMASLGAYGDLGGTFYGSY